MGWKFNNQLLGELLQQKRQAEGLGLRDVAAQCKVSPSTLSRVERGELPDMDTLLALFSWLERRPELFFTNTLETEHAAFAGKAQKFRQVIALLSELDITPERVRALEVVITGLLPALTTASGEDVATDGGRLKERPLLVHYFTATFQLENSAPRSVGLAFKAREGEADGYNLALLAFAQKSLSLPKGTQAKGASFTTKIYPDPALESSYTLVEVSEDDAGELVITRTDSQAASQ